MDRQDLKKYPKILESKNTYLRVRAPEHLDIALEGLIRKVLKEQPNMDDIYTFAADYFDTLLKIREASGIKKFSTQNLCQFHCDEDADEMIKLASSFTKRGKEPKCKSKMYRTLTLKDSDIKKTRKNSIKTISGKDVTINNTKNDEFGSLIRQSANVKSHSENEESGSTTSEITNLINLKQSDLISKENEFNINLEQLSFAELKCAIQEVPKAPSNLIQSADETSEYANETKHSYKSPKNELQLSEVNDNQLEITKDEKRFDVINVSNIKNATLVEKKLEELNIGDDNKAEKLELNEQTIEENRIAVTEHIYGNESGIPISREKEFKIIKDSTDENNSVKSKSQPDDVTNLNSSNVNLSQGNKEMNIEIDTYENKTDSLEKDSDGIKQIQQDQKQEGNDETNILDMEKTTDCNCPLTGETIAKKEIKVLENIISDGSDLLLRDTLNELNTKKSLELNQNKKENISPFKAKSLGGEKLLISESNTLHTKSMSDVQSFIEYEKQFSGIFKEDDKISMTFNTESSLHEKGESEIKIKDVKVSDPLIIPTEIINEGTNKKMSDSVSINEEISPNFSDVTEKISPLPKNGLSIIEDTVEVEDESINDQDVNSSTTSNEFEFEVYFVKDSDTLISEKLDSDIVNEESYIKEIGKSTIVKTEELTDTANKNQKINDEAQSNTIVSFDLEQHKNPAIEIFEPDIILQLNTSKSDKAEIRKASELISEKQIETNKKFLEDQETMNEVVIRNVEDKSMKIQMKLENSENCQTHGVGETNCSINNNIANGEDCKKIKQVKEIELNDENKPPQTEKIAECQNIGNEVIQTSENIEEIESGEIEENIFQVQLTTIIEAEINENIRKNLIDTGMRSNIEPILEVVVDASMDLQKEESTELETIKLIKAATIIQSGFRRFRRRKISTKPGVLEKENKTDAPNEDCARPEGKLKSDSPVDALTKSDVSEGIDFKHASKSAEMGGKTKNLSRSATKPVLSTGSLDSIKKISLQRTKSLTTIRSSRGDFEIWNQLVLELEEAAAKIQTSYRRYKSRKKLKRENAVQLTMDDSADSIGSKVLTESQELNERSTGEFHDSIVLPIYPK